MEFIDIFPSRLKKLPRNHVVKGLRQEKQLRDVAIIQRKQKIKIVFPLAEDDRAPPFTRHNENKSNQKVGLEQSAASGHEKLY